MEERPCGKGHDEKRALRKLHSEEEREKSILIAGPLQFIMAVCHVQNLSKTFAISGQEERERLQAEIFFLIPPGTKQIRLCSSCQHSACAQKFNRRCLHSLHQGRRDSKIRQSFFSPTSVFYPMLLNSHYQLVKERDWRKVGSTNVRQKRKNRRNWKPFSNFLNRCKTILLSNYALRSNTTDLTYFII